MQLVGFIVSHTFQLNKMKFSTVLKQFKLNILRHLLTVIYWIKENNCCLIDCIKNLNAGMHSDIYEPIWFILGMVTGMQESKNCCASYLPKLSMDLMEVRMLFCFAGSVNLIFILSYLIRIQSTESNLGDVIKKI